MKNLTDLIAKYGDKEIDEKKFKELFDIKDSKDSKVFIPKSGESYWHVGETGEATRYLFEDDRIDRGTINSKIVYRTRKEAEFASAAQSFKVKMKRDFAENSDEIDWGNGNQGKYFLYFDHTREAIMINWLTVHRFEGTLYTTNKAWLEQYIDDNEADIKKYVFEIKEAE